MVALEKYLKANHGHAQRASASGGQPLLKIFDPVGDGCGCAVGEPDGASLRPAAARVRLDAYPDLEAGRCVRSVQPGASLLWAVR